MKCSKCNGTGFIGGFSHISEGVCFDCMGSGVLAKGKKHTVKYAVSYVRQFLQDGYFNGIDKVEVKKIENKYHKTAVTMLMEDSNFYYIGQPICGGSTWFKFPKEVYSDFVGFYKKSHYGRNSDI